MTSRIRPGRAVRVLLWAAASGLAAPACHAGLTISIDPTTISAAPGSTGSFDVNLVNSMDGTAAYIGGDVVEIDLVGGSGIHFTGADTNTAAAYIFSLSVDDNYGSSLGAVGTPDTSITISDNDDAGVDSETTVAAGSTFGLARIFYSVDAVGSASASLSIASEDSGNSTLVNGTGTVSYAFGTQGGTLDVPSAAATPEPSTLVLAGIAGAMGAARAWRRRKQESAT